jgi:hypothetical protein
MKYCWILLVAWVVSFASLFAENSSLASTRSSNAHTLNPAVIFYFDSPASSQVWPAIRDAFRQETAHESRESLLPDTLQLLPATDLRPDSEFGQVIQVHLRGRCDVVEQAYRPLGPGPLGWVFRVSGEIQPFVYVDCERLAQVLNPKTLGMDDAQRANAMATAIARITMHEWLHITLQSATHTSHGIRRAELSVNDLVEPSASSGGD